METTIGVVALDHADIASTPKPPEHPLDCHLDGAPAPELRSALIEFARLHLLSTVGGSPRSTFSTMPTGPLEGRPDGRYFEVDVEARANLGQILVESFLVEGGQPAMGAMGRLDCFGVLRGPASTTIILSPMWDWIS